MKERTLMNRIHKYMIQYRKVYIDKVDDLVHKYNNITTAR